MSSPQPIPRSLPRSPTHSSRHSFQMQTTFNREMYAFFEKQAGKFLKIIEQKMFELENELESESLESLSVHSRNCQIYYNTLEKLKNKAIDTLKKNASEMNYPLPDDIINIIAETGDYFDAPFG